MKPLKEKAESVASRTDLAEFIRDLVKDLGENPESWENRDLPSFLSALGAWVEDMEGYFKNKGEPVPPSPEWRHLAQMLLAAKIYE